MKQDVRRFTVRFEMDCIDLIDKKIKFYEEEHNIYLNRSDIVRMSIRSFCR